jgi:ketosteroid isomerase-like protein
MKSFVLSLFLACAVMTRAANASVDAVLRADNDRLAAMMASNGAALGNMLSEELVFVHSDGRREGKREYVKNLTAGDTAYADAKTSDVQAQRVSPDVIVLTGAQSMRKKLGTEWSQIDLRFQSVWRNEAGTWRMVAWLSMKPTGNSMVPTKK